MWFWNNVGIDTSQMRVSISLWFMGRMEEYWDNPEEFKPERFLGETTKPIKTAAYFPFNTGPRTCLGKDMALIEAKIVLVWVLQRFLLRLMPGHTPQPQANLTLKVANGMWMQVVKRDFL